MLFIWLGSFSLFMVFNIAGYRLSSINVVLPLPLTPVTTFNLHFAIFKSNSLTVCIISVDNFMVPSSNISSEAVLSRIIISSSPVIYGAMMDFSSLITESIGPWDIILPPLYPDSGPISIR